MKNSPESIAAYDTAFFGHPRGLTTLFMTEVWERMSYYGMRAILILYMVATVKEGGLGFDVATAGAIYGIYTSLVYAAVLPGAWLVDNFIGRRRATFLGGCTILVGHLCLGLTFLPSFFLGLALIIIGTGLLKPCVSVMVGELYRQQDSRQDAGFSIFYMGINLGAFFGPLICGYLAQKISWHLGFAAAAFGMLFGVVQYVLGAKYLGNIGLYVSNAQNREIQASRKKQLMTGLIIAASLIVLGAIANLTKLVSFNPEKIQDILGIVFIILPIVYFLIIYLNGQWTAIERKRLIALFIFYVFSTFFWAGSEQQGSSIQLFADTLVNNNIFHWEFPSSWYQSVNPIIIIGFTPILAWLWQKLGNRNPSTSVKFSLSLFICGLGFVVMVVAASLATTTSKISPFWLFIAIFLMTIAELLLSPVGLAVFAQLSPPAVASQMMGLWFFNDSLGSLLASESSSLFDTIPKTVNFGFSALVLAIASIIMLFLVKPIGKLTEAKSANSSQE